MASLYSEAHRDLQAAFGTTRLAERLDADHVHDTILDDERAFIEGRDMLFLSTVDPDGNPTVSYKGGAPGFVRVTGPSTLVFPGYDGNGMFYSAGNIAGQNRVGLLFIDFETPHRLRLQGTAHLDRDATLLTGLPGAQYLVGSRSRRSGSTARATSTPTARSMARATCRRRPRGAARPVEAPRSGAGRAARGRGAPGEG